jgi:hypothetical protein
LQVQPWVLERVAGAVAFREFDGASHRQTK